jgi:hypothetical protein
LRQLTVTLGGLSATRTEVGVRGAADDHTNGGVIPSKLLATSVKPVSDTWFL